MNKRKCHKCGSQMEWRPIAGRWVCYECMQAPELNPWKISDGEVTKAELNPLSGTLTIAPDGSSYFISSDDRKRMDKWLDDAHQRVNARDMDS